MTGLRSDIIAKAVAAVKADDPDADIAGFSDDVEEESDGASELLPFSGRVVEHIRQNYPRFFVELENEFGQLPPGATLIYTGNDDDRMGRCQTPPEEWVYGYGLYAFGKDNLQLPRRFRTAGDWHTWAAG